MTTHAQAHPRQLEATVTVRQKKRQTDRSRNCRTRGTFHRRLQPLYTEKHTVSSSGFLPKAKPMQHSCSHYNAFCSMTWQTHMYLRTWQQSMTAIMQPLQCDLQPQIQETHKTTHTGAATRCRTQRRNQFRGKPACLDTHMATKRDNNHVAIPLRSATTDSKTPYNYARTSTPKAKSLLQCGTKKRPHTGGTFHRRLQPLYTEKHKVSCSGFLPKTKPMCHSCSHHNAFCSMTWQTHMYLHTWQQNVTTIM